MSVETIASWRNLAACLGMILKLWFPHRDDWSRSNAPRQCADAAGPPGKVPVRLQPAGLSLRGQIGPATFRLCLALAALRSEACQFVCPGLIRLV
jgi:hypothetical protein